MNQFQPAFSPDGQWIAYVTWCDSIGGSLWRIPAAGGRPEQLTHSTGEYRYPAWLPDGSRIAVVMTQPNFHYPMPMHANVGKIELESIHGDSVWVAVDSVPAIGGVSFSADGRRIFYDPNMGNLALKPHLVSKNLEGNGTKVVIGGNSMPHGKVYIPSNSQKSISPDGRYIVYSAGEDLYLQATDNVTAPTALQETSRALPVQFATGIDPCWERNGEVLAWTYGNQYYRVDPDKIMELGEKVKGSRLSKKSEYNYITVSAAPDEAIPIPLSVPMNCAHGTVALKNVRILTMQGDKVIERGTILIRDRRILAEGPVQEVNIPQGVFTLDLAGATVMPGLIDLHYHFGAESTIIPQQYWMLQVALAYGTTTIRDPSQHLISYGFAEMLNAGLMTGPRLFTTGEPVVISLSVLPVKSPEDARQVVQKRLRMGSLFVKNYLVTEPRLSSEWLQIACQEAGLNMTNEGQADLTPDLARIKDGNPGIEHNPHWNDVYKDVLTFFARSGTFLTPTLQIRAGPDDLQQIGKSYFNYQYWRQPDNKFRHFWFSDTSQFRKPANLESIEIITKNSSLDEEKKASIFKATAVDARIRKLGGRITLGSHGNDAGIGPHNELWALQMGGLTNMEALQAGTIMGAEALGLQKDLGSLEVGKIADLIVLNKNPLDDIHNSREIRYVMKDGILYDGDTLDEIWPEKKKCQLWREPGDPAKVRSLPAPQEAGSGRD
jgi:imidazolonepropionase-like amidohydrolase